MKRRVTCMKLLNGITIPSYSINVILSYKRTLLYFSLPFNQNSTWESNVFKNSHGNHVVVNLFP